MINLIAVGVYAIAVLIPQAIVYARLKWGLGAGIVAYLILCAITYAFAGPFFALEFGAVFGAAGLFLSIFAKNKFGVERVFLYTLIFIIVTSLLNFATTLKYRDKWNVKEHISKSIGALPELSPKDEGKSQKPKEIDPKIQERMEQAKKILMLTFPSINVVLLSVLVLIHLLLLKEIWHKLAKERGFYDLTRWRAKEFFIWPFLVSGFSIILPKDSALFAIGLNIFIISCLPFLFQGMSLLSFFMKKYKFPLVARAIAYVLVFSQVWFIILIFLGLADIWADLRKLKSVTA